jgi:phage protein D
MDHFVAVHSRKNAEGIDRAMQSGHFDTQAEAKAQIDAWKQAYPDDDFTVLKCGIKCGGHKFIDPSLKV